MFEKIIFPKFKDESLEIGRNPVYMQLMMQWADIPMKNKEEREAARTKADNFKAEYAREYKETMNLYTSVWQDLIDTIDNDPQIIAYKNLNPGKSTVECLTALQTHFEKENAEGLAKRIGNMKAMYDALQTVIDGKYTENPGVLNGEVTLMNGVGEFIYFLNYTNALVIDQTAYKHYKKPEKSLLEEAYHYNDQNEYANIQKSPEALLAIRLGQIAKTIETKAHFLESVGKLFQEVNSKDLSLAQNKSYDKFIREYNIQTGYNKYNELMELRDVNQKIVDQCNELKQKYQDGKIDELYAANKEAIDKIIEAESKDEIDLTVDIAKKKAEEKAIQYGEALVNGRKIDLEQYQREYDLYESRIKQNEATQEDLDEAIKLEADLTNEYNNLLAGADEKNKQITEKRAQLEKQQKEAYENDSKKIADAKAKLDEITNDHKAIEVAIADMQIDAVVLEEYRDNQKDAGLASDTLDFITTCVPDKTSAALKAKMFDMALSGRKISSSDFMKEGLSEEDKQIMFGAFGIADGLKALQNSNPKLYGFINSFVKNAKPYDAMMDCYKSAVDKINEFAKSNPRFVTAELTLDKMREKYGNNMADNSMISKAAAEVQGLMDKAAPAFDKKAFDEQTKALLDANMKAAEVLKNEKLDPAKKQVEMLKNSFVEAKEPDASHIKSLDDIEKAIQYTIKQNFNEDEIRKAAKDDFIKNNFKKCVEKFINNTIEDKSISYKIVNEIKSIDRKIEEVYKFDKEQTQKKAEVTTELRNALENFKNDRVGYCKNICDEAKMYFDSIEKGRSKGHSNSDEFERMKTAVENFSKLYENGKQPSEAEIKTGLTAIKNEAQNYYDEKQKGIHIIPSKMRAVRLAMSLKLQKFADDAAASLDKYSLIANSVSAKIEAFNKSVSSREVLPNEDAMSHFVRCCCEAQGLKLDPKKNQLVEDKKSVQKQENIQLDNTVKSAVK